MNKINLISNLNTIDLKKENSLTIAFYKLTHTLKNSGFHIELINQDENYIFFKVLNLINGYLSSVIDLTNNELLNFSSIDDYTLKTALWSKTI